MDGSKASPNHERGETSGEDRVKIVIAIIRVPAVDVRAVGIGVAEVHEVPIRRAAFSYFLWSVASTRRMKKSLKYRLYEYVAEVRTHRK